MKDKKKLNGFLILYNQAFIELERFELFGMFALLSNFISTFPKHDLDDGLGKVWALIRVNQIYETITTHNDRTIDSYIKKLIDKDFLVKKKTDNRKIYFRLTDKGKALLPKQSTKDNKQPTETISVPSEIVIEKNETTTPKILIKPDDRPTGKECPECREALVIRNGQFGDFVCCSNFPKCKYKPDNKDKDKIIKNVVKQEVVETNEDPFIKFATKKENKEPPNWV